MNFGNAALCIHSIHKLCKYFNLFIYMKKYLTIFQYLFHSQTYLNLNFNYNVSPFINYVFEFQTGNLHGNLKDNGIITRGFINNFSAVVLRGQVQAGGVGIGAGGVKSGVATERVACIGLLVQRDAHVVCHVLLHLIDL